MFGSFSSGLAQHNAVPVTSGLVHGQQQHGNSAQHGPDAVAPIDIHALSAAKGYNPLVFETRPPQARFFVIKSFTEDDVFKSIKFEIWSSTVLGNNRLDKAFTDQKDKGPIYLFFSVNASGHFCGVAEMLTALDYTVTSNVWAQGDKWKGVMKLRWIYIKDIPNPALRHLKLTNTNEQKPVTSSRDTQEVPYEQGCEMLRIFVSYQSKTSLLQGKSSLLQ
ncbi:YTH-domain-containing protein [Cystobasidium minutum MCA 4210]|uniref:YTH-domain-containing protein n=1 Tax=Cystobasidium minutum MCA 4210 TaxID=1397322 RepID=UPI0034CE5FE4|eukprot:jgi/Rhomi1/143655/e_gw1.4.148.1